MRRGKIKQWITISVIGFVILALHGTEVRAEEINEQLPEEPGVLRGYEGNEEHDYILLKNGELWQIFPEVEKITDQVQKADYCPYGNWEEEPMSYKAKVWFLKNDGTVWNIGESEAVQVDENVKELNYPGTVLKNDGKLYRSEIDVDGNEENRTLVSGNVTRTFVWGYQKADGSIWDFHGCTLEAGKVDYASEAGYSISGEGFYIYGWNEAMSCINSKNNINIGDCKLKEVSAVKYSVEDDYDCYKLGIAEDDSVWAIPVEAEDNTAVYCGENAEYIMPTEVFEADIDWVDKDGHIYKKDKQLVPSLENPLRRSYFNTSGSTWAELSVIAENEGYVAIKDNEIIMDHILVRETTSYEPNEKQHAFVLKTDGSVWDVTENPVEIGKIEDNVPNFVRGDVTGDNEVDIKDLRTVLRSVCGKEELTENQKLAADVTGDDQVDIQDLRKLLRFVCGKMETLD